MIIIIAILAVIAFMVWRKYFKLINTGSMVCVTGGVKSGKSTFSFYIAYKKYKRNLRAVRIRNFFLRLFRKPLDEEPKFYTVIPVSVPHVLLTDELLVRAKRFAYRSVIWIDEASLFADSQSYKNAYVNRQLNLFNKLIAHETKGGCIVYNTQSIGDLHYSIRRCLSEIYYVHDTFKYLPFFLVSTVREERYAEDSAVNVYESDVEDTLKRVLIPKSVWKKFDCYCYSALTDDLPKHARDHKTDTLKAREIITLDFTNKEIRNEKKDS